MIRKDLHRIEIQEGLHFWYFNLGSNYCPALEKNQKWSDIYMSHN